MERETLINRGSGRCQGRSIRAANAGAGLGARFRPGAGIAAFPQTFRAAVD
jgi:hypothetical protein